MRLRSLSMTVAAIALLGGATALACDDRAEIKGPVHITSRGVEFVDTYPGDEAAHRDNRHIAMHVEIDRHVERAAAAAEREAKHEQLRIARAVASAADEIMRELNEERGEIARSVANAVREARNELRDEHRRIGREVAEAAREAVRSHRKVMAAARAAAREVARSRNVQVYVQKAMLVARDALGQAHDGLAEAERDLNRQMRKLDAMVDGDFSDVVVDRDGVVKCGDVTRHPGCEPLTEEDKEEIRETTQAALEQAQAGLEAAREGLEAAAEAMNSD